MVAGDYVIGGFSIGETLATASEYAMSGNSVNSVTFTSGFRRLAMVAGASAADHDQTLAHGLLRGSV